MSEVPMKVEKVRQLVRIRRRKFYDIIEANRDDFSIVERAGDDFIPTSKIPRLLLMLTASRRFSTTETWLFTYSSWLQGRLDEVFVRLSNARRAIGYLSKRIEQKDDELRSVNKETRESIAGIAQKAVDALASQSDKRDIPPAGSTDKTMKLGPVELPVPSYLFPLVLIVLAFLAGFSIRHVWAKNEMHWTKSVSEMTRSELVTLEEKAEKYMGIAAQAQEKQIRIEALEGAVRTKDEQIKLLSEDAGRLKNEVARLEEALKEFSKPEPSNGGSSDG